MGEVKRIPRHLIEGVTLNNISRETGLNRNTCINLRRDGFENVSLGVYCESYVYLVTNKMRKVKMCFSSFGGFSVPLIFIGMSSNVMGLAEGRSLIKIDRRDGSVSRYKLYGLNRRNYDSDLNGMSIEIWRKGLYFGPGGVRIGKIVLKLGRVNKSIPKYLYDRYGIKYCRRSPELMKANRALIEGGKMFDWMVWGSEREVLKCGDKGIYAIKFKHGCVFFKNWENPEFYAFQDYHGNLWREPGEDEKGLIEAMLRAITSENELSKVFVL